MADSSSGSIAFELVTPTRLVASEDEVEMVVVPGGAGDYGVLVGHTPLISTLRPGVVEVHQGGQVTMRVFVEGGFAEATSARCTVLASAAEMVDDIDAADAQAKLTEARDALGAADEDGRESAEAAVTVAEARVQAVSGAGGH